MVCDEVHISDSELADLPDVVVDSANSTVRICGSTRWNGFGDLSSLFVGIISHESLHLTLLKIDGNSSDDLDEIASLSTISRSLKDVPLVRNYFHGMIGLAL